MPWMPKLRRDRKIEAAPARSPVGGEAHPSVFSAEPARKSPLGGQMMGGPGEMSGRLPGMCAFQTHARLLLDTGGVA